MKHFYFITIKAVVMLMFITVTSSMMGQKIALENNWGKQGATLLEQNTSGVTLNFSVQDYVISETSVDKEIMKTITMSGVLLQNSEGAPNVPGYSRYVAIPQGSVAKARVVRKQTNKVSDISIAPAPRIPLDTDKGPLLYKKDAGIYKKNSIYPENVVAVSEPMN